MDGRTLFSNGDLGQHLAQARAKAEQALLDYNPDQLLLASETDVVDYLIGLGTIEELVLHRDEAYQLDSPAEITKWVHDRWDRQKHQRRVTRYTVVVPFSGDPKLFDLRASTFGLAPPYAYVGRQEIHLFWDSDYGHGTAEVIKSHIGEELTRIETSVGFTNNDIARHNKTLASAIPGLVSKRRAKHLADKQIQADLGFPLKTRRDAATYTVPITRKKVVPTRPPQERGQAYTPEPAMGEAEYEQALKVLLNSRNALERSPSIAAKFTEEEIRDILLIGLNAQFEGAASGEVFNGAGKTDILIREDDRNIFIGECKIWNGPKKFAAAIDQLLSYTTWRDTKAALLIFVKSGDVTAITTKAVTAVTEHPNFKRKGTHASEDRHDFVLHANGDPNREIKLALMLFVIPTSTA
ncbi:hypothetical protein Psed_6951 (plasmid) [Pseudonocardia dioxanivorans CB1190]|uniref:Uncharacterized protein n=1 Tax=Pseudonocardia dioxanivorans (strain ATCC 55486 / DSM 44775 / JCM 13855 / CB1190) TaxID=675635 RepID=F2L741_PSEUX|nr:hypothetical protein [Pseudonocardia dioxanivorans]AEA29014.1 hypothetical protein Psed_6951 [Pseudonocardia dioxanivorans CB1190]